MRADHTTLLRGVAHLLGDVRATTRDPSVLMLAAAVEDLRKLLAETEEK